MSGKPRPRPSNPFVHARALTPEESIDRVERERLLDLVEGGHNTVLHAPRRFGKTTLVKQVLQGATKRGMPGVLVDLSDVLSLADVAARLEQAFRACREGSDDSSARNSAAWRSRRRSRE